MTKLIGDLLQYVIDRHGAHPICLRVSAGLAAAQLIHTAVSEKLHVCPDRAMVHEAAHHLERLDKDGQECASVLRMLAGHLPA